MTESQLVECKQSWRDEFLRWICGFANADGGVLAIGKNDRGEVVGVAEAARLLEEIPNKVRDMLGIVVALNLRQTGGLPWLEIAVDPHPFPVSYKGEYHVRSGSTKQELKGTALDAFLLRKHGRRWDAVPLPGVRVADLDSATLEVFRQRAARSGRVAPQWLKGNDEALCDQLHLVEGPRLKRAAVLLFHPEPERYISGAFVKVGRFKNGAGLQFHDEVRGPLIVQVDRTLDLLLNKYLPAMVSFEGLQRVERHPIPEAALREAVVNAVVHNDYASATPVQIRIEDDAVRFWNAGELEAGWTVETLLGVHPSRPSNPDIANAFFRSGLIEAWGSGFERMAQACVGARCAAPRARVDAGGVWLAFERPEIGVGARPESEVESEAESRAESGHA